MKNSKKQQIMFVVNAQAGRGEGLACKRKIEEAFGDSLITVTAPEGRNSAFNLGRRAVQEGVDILVSVGGDGTHNLVINGLMAGIKEKGLSFDNLPVIGLMGTGTGNNFTKNLGISSDFKEALEVIKNGHIRAVDLGLLTFKEEKKYFVNVLSFGFDGLVVAALKKIKEKKVYGLVPKRLISLIYLAIAVARIVPGLPSYKLILSDSVFHVEIEAHLLALCNGSTYGGVFRVAPKANMSDGLFDACLISRANRFKAAGLLLRAIWGRHIGSSHVRSFNFSSLVVSSLKPLPCEMDGEVISSERGYKITVLLGILKVLVPRH